DAGGSEAVLLASGCGRVGRSHKLPHYFLDGAGSMLRDPVAKITKSAFGVRLPSLVLAFSAGGDGGGSPEVAAAHSRLRQPGLCISGNFGQQIIALAIRLNRWSTHESPARTGEEGRGLANPHSRPSPGRREGSSRHHRHIGLHGPDKSATQTRVEGRRALGATENHILGTANCKRVSDSALAFSAGDDGAADCLCKARGSAFHPH